uniref:Ribosomal RNA-processing protein 14/surfeit locus protein 6 C-terminal domain-containing protein n=1 Tax=Pseudo-nitzschia australis TaxID=44445 RepID=A0A7S4ATI7_9STRA|mmetsp:Transcript_13036/g.27432  ORF Transcript_13036/g.27432 Transcript_13036/m.27432 type:complete len:446 (+) Transcript_13036:230-1567(+)|eukprot:CAMPEP_0168198962 /NCGR_PEP_ID=MMETSP0139_2-20121125/22111_1 /TAXON_ID=44445 /ORGANISM="Pseudo-nitzschia australis, Strain 10249 10 AB" /LENGTH=445 /DNA_ID=CAMNT_0008123803 /DNA_START=183 /DNA_END=1520 /DNA_ORIENTATION=+
MAAKKNKGTATKMKPKSRTTAEKTISTTTTKTTPTAPSAGALYHDLLKDLTEHNLYFDELVDAIPSKLYIEGQSGDDYNPKYFKGQAKESKEARRARNKQSKRAKFDPAMAETTTQMKQRLDGDAFMPQKPKPMNANLNTRRLSKPAGQSAGSEDAEAKIPTTTAATAITNSTAADDKKSRIEALREKLHAKLLEKRGNRPLDPNSVSKRAARRAEKKKRQEEAIRRNKKKTTSSAETNNNNNKRLKLSGANGAANGMGDPSVDLAQVDFGRLAGLNPVGNGNYTEVNKALKNLSKSKNLEKMLADAESKKKRLEELKKSDKQTDKEKAANIEWGHALKEATGERVKDDPAKIKKALKRKAAKKLKSSKAWKTRIESTQSKMDERQKIRNHNLSKRKVGGSAGANLSSKRIEVEKEGDDKKKGGRRLSRAGFEGKKQDFLNKKEQ